MPRTTSRDGIPQVTFELTMDKPLVDELLAYGARQAVRLERNQVILEACAQLVGYRRDKHLHAAQSANGADDARGRQSVHEAAQADE